nr:hypothetical protein SYMBAF_100137 [Serratia symbiotica]
MWALLPRFRSHFSAWLLYSLLIGIYYQDAQQHRLAALCKQSKYQKNLQGKGNYAFTEMGQTNDRGTIASQL